MQTESFELTDEALTILCDAGREFLCAIERGDMTAEDANAATIELARSLRRTQ